MNTMPKACGVPEHQSTHESGARRGRPDARHARIIDFDPEIEARTDRVRFLLNQHLTNSAKRQIGDALGLRRESVTRQLDPQRTERLSEDVAIWGQLALEMTDSMADVALEVRNLRYAGTATVVVQIPSGKDEWTFTFKRSTGEIKP